MISESLSLCIIKLKVMVLEILRESDLTLPDDAVEAILDKVVTINY